MQCRNSSSLSQGKDEETLEEYIANNKINYNNPGLLFNWNDDAVALFVDEANLAVNQRSEVMRPAWLQLSDDGQINSEGFKRDIIDQLKRVGGGRSFKVVLVAPNTLVEYSRIVRELDGIETHPFLQNVMKSILQTSPEVGFLAKLAVVHDRRNAQGHQIGSATVSSELIHLFN